MADKKRLAPLILPSLYGSTVAGPVRVYTCTLYSVGLWILYQMARRKIASRKIDTYIYIYTYISVLSELVYKCIYDHGVAMVLRSAPWRDTRDSAGRGFRFIKWLVRSSSDRRRRRPGGESRWETGAWPKNDFGGPGPAARTAAGRGSSRNSRSPPTVLETPSKNLCRTKIFDFNNRFRYFYSSIQTFRSKYVWIYF